MSETQTVVTDKPTRVFISYSHDSLDHRERVLGFSNKLRSHGIESIVDRYFEDTLDMRWTDWMYEQIENAKFVLLVSTQGYLARLKPGVASTPGQGVNFEGALITQQLYEEHGQNQKFFAVYFSEQDSPSIPVYLKGFTNYDVGTDEGYVKLYRRLTNRPETVLPPVGAIVDPSQLYPQPPTPRISSDRDSSSKQRVEDLARAYQELRKSMRPGDARTRKMEIVAAKMRALACDAYFMLDYLAKNPQPGCRLAAVSLLEVKPNPDYLDWLAERLAPEKPFVGYHAALALVAAARTLSQEFRGKTSAAIQKAHRLLGAGLEATDRGRTLDVALKELAEAESLTKESSMTDRPPLP